MDDKTVALLQRATTDSKITYTLPEERLLVVLVVQGTVVVGRLLALYDRGS